jgi:hypothetical protein
METAGVVRALPWSSAPDGARLGRPSLSLWVLIPTGPGTGGRRRGTAARRRLPAVRAYDRSSARMSRTCARTQAGFESLAHAAGFGDCRSRVVQSCGVTRRRRSPIRRPCAKRSRLAVGCPVTVVVERLVPAIWAPSRRTRRPRRRSMVARTGRCLLKQGRHCASSRSDLSTG